MGNNATCKVAGKGNVKLKLADGMIITMNNVRFLPDLRNLISLGSLEEKGLFLQS